MTDNYSVQSWVARTTCGSPHQESDIGNKNLAFIL